MYKDTKKFVRSCTTCLSRRNSFNIPTAPHQPVVQSHVPGETCHIDIFGPLKPIPRGNKFVFSMIDASTKYIHLVPLPDLKSSTTLSISFLPCKLQGNCIFSPCNCDSTLHLAFAPLEESLQDSEPTGLPLQGPVTAWSNCACIMLRTVTLLFTQPQESSPRLGHSSYRFFIFPFKTWTVVHDQEFASARRKDDGTVGTAVAIAFILYLHFPQ
ncbi:integrase catalytic domain-containing protein [Trichonephila inaurata madagascariensis]|uniref:Integrase catalytic domain-containing protein n=1 Tax=Trichonephila inaurata madagascariensis TaxID=2747483 RepID=A0A8X6XXY3_9ARAC|nr:integrase catalytic domain-containing protein [Trichonephila inaurata madagascariensis]